MLQLVKTKRQANFKDFKRFGAFKGLVEQKNVFNLLNKLLFLCIQRPCLDLRLGVKDLFMHKKHSLHWLNGLNKIKNHYKLLSLRSRRWQHS
jgi:hypothetical protein